MPVLQLLFQLKRTDIDPAIINGCGTSAYKLDYKEKGVTVHCCKTPQCTKPCLLGSARLSRIASSNTPPQHEPSLSILLSFVILTVGRALVKMSATMSSIGQ